MHTAHVLTYAADSLQQGSVQVKSRRAGNEAFAAAFKAEKENSPRCLRIWNLPDVVPKVLAHSPAVSASYHTGAKQ